MRVLAELWNDTDYTFVSSTAQRVQRWMADEGIRDTRAPAGGQRQRMDDAERDDIQDALDEEEGREGGAREGRVADEADEGVGEPDLPGEEVVMTSRGVGRAGPAPRAPRPKLDRAKREKRVVGEAGVEVRDTGREKRARQTTIDEMYAKEKLAEFTDAWLQWIYVKGLSFNAFRGPEFQKVRQTAERVPRSIQFRFPSFRVTAGAGIPSQRAKVATMVSEVRAAFRHRGATMLFDGRKSRSGKRLVTSSPGAPMAPCYTRPSHTTGRSETPRTSCTHERINTARRCKLGFAKLAQLVEIATNLKLASCARQGGGYVLPWVMGTGRGETAAEDEDEDGDVEPEVWGARPASSVPEVEIELQIPEALRRSKRLASAAGRDRTHDGEDRGGERTPSDAGIRPRSPSVLRTDDFDVVGLGGSLGDFSVEECRRASPSDVRTDTDVVRGPVETEEERDARLDREEEERLGSLPRWEGRFAYLDEQRRQREMETGGGGGRDVDASGVPEEAVQEEFDDEGQDAAAGGESGGGRRDDEETAGDEGQDVVMGGGFPSGGRGDSETAGDEGQAAAMCGRGEGGPVGDGDTTGVGGDDGPDGDDDDDHGPEDDAYRLALVLRDPTVPPLRPDDTQHTFFNIDSLAQALTDDRFAHVSRKSGKMRAPGRVYSPPPFVVESPHWSGSLFSGVRGRESGAGEVGSGRRSDGGRDSAGSMPPPPARTPEGMVDTGDWTATPGVAHSGGSPPTVRCGVGGGWSAVRRVGDRLRADYDTERGVFTGRTPVQTQTAEGGSGHPSLQMAGRLLGLSLAETRRSLVIEAAGTSTDMLRGEQFTSGEEGLLMRPGMRRQHGLSEVEARLAAGVAAGQAALDAIQREREMGIAARAGEDEDSDTEFEPTETAARRHRAQVVAAAAAAQAAYLSGARGTGAGGRGGRWGGPHGRPSSGRGRARSGGR
ncbi:hypothetical protein CBR_g16087 [Chara braunii]|uniref:Uncharacterized protein n=1 Tax=Chara braunii TaxID=69332 RepID=A0A388KTN8_CHABU|nr:hypothetical protein CBR_g16087 [Chara braunii]|eukprot:GBG73372.1 hypothetical protein CBR_g16087 [Chara braunii]